MSEVMDEQKTRDELMYRIEEFCCYQSCIEALTFVIEKALSIPAVREQLDVDFLKKTSRTFEILNNRIAAWQNRERATRIKPEPFEGD